MQGRTSQATRGPAVDVRYSHPAGVYGWMQGRTSQVTRGPAVDVRYRHPAGVNGWMHACKEALYKIARSHGSRRPPAAEPRICIGAWCMPGYMYVARRATAAVDVRHSRHSHLSECLPACMATRYRSRSHSSCVLLTHTHTLTCTHPCIRRMCAPPTSMHTSKAVAGDATLTHARLLPATPLSHTRTRMLPATPLSHTQTRKAVAGDATHTQSHSQRDSAHLIATIKALRCKKSLYRL